MTVNILCVFGTRPEAIKMAPLIKKLKATSFFSTQVCVTGQHEQMLQTMLDLFAIVPDFNLKVMDKNQDLSGLTAKILLGLADVFAKNKPHLILVHGDTTTTFVASLSAYYHRIPVAHVEAGLRTGNLYSPWPEEINRKLAAALALLHFAPTAWARDNLLREGFPPETIHVTGNTVIDALMSIVNKIESETVLAGELQAHFSFLQKERRLILVTGHRRENFGDGFSRICQALVLIAQRFPFIDIVYPVHLNPQVQEPVEALLQGINNIYLIKPVDYVSFIYLMKRAYLILTDSGGVQEEAPALGKPVLIMRNITERPEAIAAGTAKLVGTNVEQIVNAVDCLLHDKKVYEQMSQAKNPYGDGFASERIVDHLLRFYQNKTELLSFSSEKMLQNTRSEEKSEC